MKLKLKNVGIKMEVLIRLDAVRKYMLNKKGDPNGRQPICKMAKLKDNQNGRQPKWKTTKMEDDQN